MSLVLPVLFHWAPIECRPGIIRRGLKPTCPTAVPMSAPIAGTHHAREVDPEGTTLAVCLGTSPSHAWSLCGALFAERGSRWDLWQVTLDDGDEVHPLPFWGHRLDEIRVANRIPKSRIWHVATRTVGARRWSAV